MSTKRIANMSMLVALAIIFSYIEFLIPINLEIPGNEIRIGKSGNCYSIIYIKNQ